MVIYGIHPVEEALRGRRKVHRIWATEKGDWPGKVFVVGVRGDRGAVRARTRIRASRALVDPYPYADAADFLAVRDPLIVALDEVTDPQNLGAIARTAEAVGATGIVIPERRCGGGHAGGLQGVGGGGRARADRAASATSPTSSWRPRSRAAGSTARRPARRTRYDQPDYTGGVVAVLGAEGKGLRQRVASMCDDLVSLPLRGKHRVAQRLGDRRGGSVRDVAAAT